MEIIVAEPWTHVQGSSVHVKLGQVGWHIDPMLKIVETGVVGGHNLVEQHINRHKLENVSPDIAGLGLATNAMLPIKLRHPHKELERKITNDQEVDVIEIQVANLENALALVAQEANSDAASKFALACIRTLLQEEERIYNLTQYFTSLTGEELFRAKK